MYEESCTYIPFAPEHELDDRSPEHDRLTAYKLAWTHALERIQDISHRLQESVVVDVLQHVHAAYMDPLPGLPRTELPAIVVNGGTTLVSSIVRQLRSDGQDDLRPFAYVSQLHPTECNNMMNTMKALIAGFLSYEEGGQKRRNAASLTSYDINLLRAWSEHVRKSSDGNVLPPLVVVLHHFEQFNTDVVQDLFHICSQHVPDLPFIFLLSTLSPVPVNFIQSTYRRNTLALLKLSYVASPSGMDVVEDIVSSVFFDPVWEPVVMIGSSTLAYIQEFATRYHASTDMVTSVLQLAHMKHFDQPLAPLIDPTFGTEHLETEPELIHDLLVRVQALPASQGASWANVSSAELLNAVSSARLNFAMRTRGTREAYALAWRVYSWFFAQGYKVLEDGGRNHAHPRMTVMRKVLECTLLRDVKYWGMMVGKLNAAKLEDLVPILREHMTSSADGGEAVFVDQLREVEEELADIAISAALVDSELDVTVKPNRDPRMIELADHVRALFLAYMTARLDPLDSDAVPLWDMWYMGSTPFPAELLNPAPRATILGALAYPHIYALAAAAATSGEKTQPSGKVKLADLPDTAIVFRRYLDAGRMVNVHDWFESFKLVLEDQRSDDAAEDDEEWSLEVQSRFMRSLHELDWVGLIKHTNRKPDHVMKTVWDLPE